MRECEGEGEGEGACVCAKESSPLPRPVGGAEAFPEARSQYDDATLDAREVSLCWGHRWVMESGFCPIWRGYMYICICLDR